MPIISIRDDCPAIDVRDRTLWARDPRTAGFYADLGDAQIEQLWQDTAEDFWQNIVPAIATEHGYDPDDVTDAGRSNGWLIVRSVDADIIDAIGKTPADLSDLPDDADSEDVEEDRERVRETIANRDRFLRFADAIETGVKAAGDSFVERVRSEHTELQADREAAIVKGEN